MSQNLLLPTTQCPFVLRSVNKINRVNYLQPSPGTYWCTVNIVSSAKSQSLKHCQPTFFCECFTTLWELDAFHKLMPSYLQ